MSLPRCPRCMTPIEEDWDYCHTCGLSAEEIVAAMDAGPVAAAAPQDPTGAAPPGAPYAPTADLPQMGAPEGFTPPPAPPGDMAPPSGGFAPPVGPAPAMPLSSMAPPGASGAPPMAPPPSGPPPYGGDAGPPPDGEPQGPPPGNRGVDPMAAPPGASLMSGPPPVSASPDAQPPLLGGAIPKPAIIGAVVLVLALIGVLAVFGSRGREGTQDTSSGAPAGGLSLKVGEEDAVYAPPATGQFPLGQGGWIIFQPDDKTFSIEMPKPPTNLQLYTFPVKDVDTQTLLFNALGASGGYTIAVAEVGPPDEPDVQEFLRKYAIDYGTAIKAKAEAGKEADHYGNPARDFVLTAANFQLKARVVRSGTRVYVLAAGGTDPSVYSWEHFRNSFNPHTAA